MTAPRRYAFVAAGALAASLTAAGCSGSGSTTASASPSTTRSAAAPTPSPSSTSAFCLDLSTFQVGVLSYRGDAGRAIQGRPLDFTEMRRKAALIASWGKRMRADAPPDIAEDFQTVLDAVATSARKLKPGGSARAVVDPLYGKSNRGAFDAVSKYECR
ncbi:hypothetical protein [Actinomadura sp. 9N407]|uniref:hypothetical protein n=1 Tax=Actinomadura sp. 9N407 TaxID=3375154 RepID=UPI0037B9081E